MLTASKKNIAVTKSHMYNSVEKDKIREKLLFSHPNPEYILTFGGMELVDVKKFFRQYGNCHIISIERDRKIWEKQKQIVNNRAYPSVTVINKEFENFIEDIPSYSDFDIVYLDFNCIFNKKVEDNFKKLLLHLKSGTIIGTTFVGCRDGVESISDSYIFNITCSKRYEFYKNNRTSAISQTLSSFAANMGKDLKELDRVEYINTGDKTPMIFLMFKVL